MKNVRRGVPEDFKREGARVREMMEELIRGATP